MTHSQWLKTHTPIDKLVAAALPVLDKLEKLRFNASLDKHSGTIEQTVKTPGVRPD
jgi:hypothetical protein